MYINYNLINALTNNYTDNLYINIGKTVNIKNENIIIHMNNKSNMDTIIKNLQILPEESYSYKQPRLL